MRALLAELIPDTARSYLHPPQPRGWKPALRPATPSTITADMTRWTWSDPGKLAEIDTYQVIPLTTHDLPRIEALYQAAYPETWFNPRMLETGQYVGI